MDFDDIPFEHELTSHCLKYLLQKFTADDLGPITGFCDGAVFNSSMKLFFKAGFDTGTTDMVKHEHNILTQLQCYDFIPRVVGVKEIGRYYFLFIERLNGISLDTIDCSDPRWKLGISKSLDLLLKLYRECGFLHKDMHTNNIFLDKNNKVYLLDFAFSYISSSKIPDKSWVNDLIVFINSIDKYPEHVDEEAIDAFEIELMNLGTSLDPDQYQEKIGQLRSLILK